MEWAVDPTQAPSEKACVALVGPCTPGSGFRVGGSLYESYYFGVTGPEFLNQVPALTP